MKANYDLISDQWSSLREQLPPKDKELFDFFVDRLPQQARVLDLGCGSGNPIAKQLAEKGFSVVGVDRSKSLLQKARENVPSGIFHLADIEAYDIQPGYNGVVLWDVIFHIPREEHQAILQKIYESLTPDGYLVMSSGGSDEELPPFTDFMFGAEFFYDAFSPAKLLSLCEKIGYNIRKHVVVNEPDGKRDRGRIGIVLSRA